MTPETARVRGTPARIARVAAAALALHVSCAPAHAQSRIWFASAHYESPLLVVPIAFVTTSDEEGEWSVGVAGWTLSAEWKASLRNRRRLHLVSRFTPVNAHSSNYVYTSGRRDPSAEYRNASVEAGGGLEVQHARTWTGGYRLLMQYDSVEGVDPELRQFWKRPFAGLEVTQRFIRVTSDELFGSRWEGVKAGLDARLVTGARTWSRVQAQVAGGARTGPLFLFGRIAGFTGHSLNGVSAFLVGGSWDLAVPTLLSGYRYAEFRLERAMVGSGAADVRVVGPWEAGLRAACVAAPRIGRCGMTVQVTTVWNGAVIRAGVGAPITDREGRRPVVFGSIAVALVQR